MKRRVVGPASPPQLGPSVAARPTGVQDKSPCRTRREQSMPPSWSVQRRRGKIASLRAFIDLLGASVPSVHLCQRPKRSTHRRQSSAPYPNCFIQLTKSGKAHETTHRLDLCQDQPPRAAGCQSQQRPRSTPLFEPNAVSSGFHGVFVPPSSRQCPGLSRLSQGQSPWPPTPGSPGL